MTYDNTNKGILSRNDRKEEESHPDFKGQINVAGVEYWLSGWIKERKDGSGKFFSLSVKPKDAPQGRPAPAPRRPNRQDDYDDSIPF
jgi:hypothetical protein